MAELEQAAAAIERQPLAEALRAELLKLVTDGDPKAQGSLTSDVLMRVMRVAKTGRELLVSLNASPSSLAAMLRRPRGGGFISMGGEPPEEDGLGDVQNANFSPFAGAPLGENFGMTAIRELVAAAKNLNGSTSPAKLVEAIAVAKEKGLPDVVRELESQLGIGNGKPLAQPVPVLVDWKKEESSS